MARKKFSTLADLRKKLVDLEYLDGQQTKDHSEGGKRKDRDGERSRSRGEGRSGGSRKRRRSSSRSPSGDRKRKEKPKTTFKGVCYNCNQPGHRKADCRAPAYQQQERYDAADQPKGGSGKRPGLPAVKTNKAPALLAIEGAKKTSKVNINKVESVQPYSAIVISFNIEGKEYTGTLDTGSDADFLENEMPQVAGRMHNSRVIAIAAGGHRLNILGAIDTIFGYKDHSGQWQEIEVEVPVMKDLADNMLIGNDVALRTNMVIDLGKRTVSCSAPITGGLSPGPQELHFQTTRSLVDRQASESGPRADSEPVKPAADDLEKQVEKKRANRPARETKSKNPLKMENVTQMPGPEDFSRKSMLEEAIEKARRQAKGLEKEVAPGEKASTNLAKSVGKTEVATIETDPRESEEGSATAAEKITAASGATTGADANGPRADPSGTAARCATIASGERRASPMLWGKPYELEDGPLADDPLEDKENPFVFWEKTKPMKILGGEVRVSESLGRGRGNAERPARRVCGLSGL